MKPGSRLKSAVCDTEVMVIRGGGDIVVECGGSPMADERPAERGALDAGFAQGTQMGKRYVDAAGTVELLCVKPGKRRRIGTLMSISLCAGRSFSGREKNVILTVGEQIAASVNGSQEAGRLRIGFQLAA